MGKKRNVFSRLLLSKLSLYCFRARMITVNKGKQLKCLLKQISRITSRKGETCESDQLEGGIATPLSLIFD